MAASLTNVSQFITGGFERVQYALSSSGLPYGTAPSPDSGQGMTIVEGAKAANPTLGDAEVLQITGDNGVRGAIQFPSNSLPTFDLIFADLTAAFLNAVQGTTTDDAQSIYDFLLIDPEDAPVVDLFLMLTQKAVSTEAGSEGNGYFTVLFPLCTATLTGLPNMQTGANEGQFTWSVTVNRVSQLPWGESLSVASHGTTKASGFVFFSEAIPTIDIFTQNGTTATYTPTQTLNSNDQVIAWNDIAGTTGTLSITPSTGDFTFTAGTSGEVTLFLYEVA